MFPPTFDVEFKPTSTGWKKLFTLFVSYGPLSRSNVEIETNIYKKHKRKTGHFGFIYQESWK